MREQDIIDDTVEYKDNVDSKSEQSEKQTDNTDSLNESNEQDISENTEHTVNEKGQIESSEGYDKDEEEYVDKDAIKAETGWSDNVVDNIKSHEEADIYKKANLREENIDGKSCLIREDINMEAKDEKGRSNAERMEKGLAPLDKKGDSIELHHIGQKDNSPLAELTLKEHHKNGNDTIIHNKAKPTEVHGEGNHWDTERKEHWKARAEAINTENQE